MVFDWGYFFLLFSIGVFWQVCVIVIVISILFWGIGLVVGFLLVCVKFLVLCWVKIFVEFYIWFFCSVLLMVLLVFVYNLLQLFLVIQLLFGVLFIVGLVLMIVIEVVYMVEIYCGGLLLVVKGQSEVGYVLSFSFIGIQWLIVIFQVFCILLLMLINEYIIIIKLSLILLVVFLFELLFIGQCLYVQNFFVMEILLVVVVYYVMVVIVFIWLFWVLENCFDIQCKCL